LACVHRTAPCYRSAAGATEVEREYERKIEKPKEVDAAKLKSYLTTDGILIVEAPVPPKSLNLRKTNHSGGSPQRSTSGTSAAAVAVAASAGANSHHGSMTSLRSNSSPAHTAAVAPAVTATISSQPSQVGRNTKKGQIFALIYREVLICEQCMNQVLQRINGSGVSYNKSF
jgi:hypothetical protein